MRTHTACAHICSAWQVQGICLIAADVRGVFASVFCDFGPAFTVLDKNDTQVRVRC
jgi:hypothetical protein